MSGVTVQKSAFRDDCIVFEVFLLMGNKTWGMDDNLIVLLFKEIREEEKCIVLFVSLH